MTIRGLVGAGGTFRPRPLSANYVDSGRGRQTGCDDFPPRRIR